MDSLYFDQDLIDEINEQLDRLELSEDTLAHYGTPRHSGRYPWGSGDDPYQHEDWYKGRERLKALGLSETEIARAMNLSTTQYRARIAIANDERMRATYEKARELYSELGPKWTEIGRRMGLRESTVRSMLKGDKEAEERRSSLVRNADILKNAVNERTYINIGPGTAEAMGISKTKLDTAVEILKNEGYVVISDIRQAQIGMPGQQTTLRVLCPPGTTKKEVIENKAKIDTIIDYRSSEAGTKIYGIEPPASLDSKRLMVRYAEDGGVNKDGVMEIRRGVEDLSLGKSNYAQVRIAVDGTHYLKGMAIYSDGKDMPDGVDIIFNTNKHKGTPVISEDGGSEVLKKMKDDPANPFGAQIKVADGKVVGQRHYIDKNGESKLSPINVVSEEGDWNEWSKTLSSQFLSKQRPEVAKRQLDLEYDKYISEFENISKFTVPEVKKKLMESFADECDSASVYLKAHAFPGQKTKVILPLTTLKDNEIYAPDFKDGEEVILVRHPHEGTFQIPVLKVNNHSKEGDSIIGKVGLDAVGITKKTADQLSGADFDGDTAIVIPTRGQNLKFGPVVQELIDFDDKASYPERPGMKYLSKENTQKEMGKISNLITDMTVQGAPLDEIVRATKYSMTVIDANKHSLDYMQCYADQNIQELKDKYQNGGGASTLISRAKSPVYVNQRKAGEYRVDPETGTGKVHYTDPETGKKLYTETGKHRVKMVTNKETGEKEFIVTDKLKQNRSKAMAETDDARTLMSNDGNGTVIENIYADYANRMKYLANEARKASLSIGNTKLDPSAKEAYADEVKSLKEKVVIAKMNKPLETKAQILAGEMLKQQRLENPAMTYDDIKKAGAKNIVYARNFVGADKKAASVKITDKEWNAILSGAVSHSVLQDIFNNTDQDRLKQLAAPRESKGLSQAMINRINRYANGKYTIDEIADALGLSPSTVSKYIAANK